MELVVYEENLIARESALLERRLREAGWEEWRGGRVEGGCEHLVHQWLALVHRKSRWQHAHLPICPPAHLSTCRVFHRRQLVELAAGEEELERRQLLLGQVGLLVYGLLANLARGTK